MNPHFIFNALNSINEFVEENERTLAKDYLSKFAGLMSSVLENSQRAEVPLASDLKALRTYMDLEQLRMSGKFDYTITVDPSIDQNTTMVPPRPPALRGERHLARHLPQGGQRAHHVIGAAARYAVDDDRGG
ncbi:MAG: histidine kinase [Flavobacteriales bacterium]|nr:histidine kinase [Flavobacteriales bacterium]